MSEKNRGTVSMRLPDGETLDAWDSFSLRDTFTDPLGQLEFVARPSRARIPELLTRVTKGTRVEVVVDKVTQGFYLIQASQRTIDRQGVTFRFGCHTPLVTPYQASVNPDIATHYQNDTSVATVVLGALGPFGFTRLVADSAASRSALTGKPISGGNAPVNVDALTHRDAQAQEGETAYGFCARIFTRLGVCLRVNHEGTLLLSAPDYRQQPSYDLVQDFTGQRAGDRMLDGIQIEDSNDEQFSECTVRGVSPDKPGQTRMARPAATIANADQYPNRATYSSPLAGYKPKFIFDKNSRDIARCSSLAKLAMGVRAPKAFSVTCEVDGIRSTTGRVWGIDTVANVFIEAEGIKEPMWILERTFLQDRSSGQKTRLKLLPLGALVLGDAPS